MGFEAVNEEWEDRTIPEDVVPVLLKDIKYESIPYKDKRTGEAKSFEKLTWIFTIPSGEYEGRGLRGETNTKMNTGAGNKFRQWAETLLGQQIPAGAKFDTDQVIGLQAKALVKHRTDKNNPEIKYAEIDELLPNDDGDSPFGFSGEPPF